MYFAVTIYSTEAVTSKDSADCKEQNFSMLMFWTVVPDRGGLCPCFVCSLLPYCIEKQVTGGIITVKWKLNSFFLLLCNFYFEVSFKVQTLKCSNYHISKCKINVWYWRSTTRFHQSFAVSWCYTQTYSEISRHRCSQLPSPDCEAVYESIAWPRLTSCIMIQLSYSQELLPPYTTEPVDPFHQQPSRLFV